MPRRFPDIDGPHQSPGNLFGIKSEIAMEQKAYLEASNAYVAYGPAGNSAEPPTPCSESAA